MEKYGRLSTFRVRGNTNFDKIVSQKSISNIVKNVFSVFATFIYNFANVPTPESWAQTSVRLYALI